MVAAWESLAIWADRRLPFAESLPPDHTASEPIVTDCACAEPRKTRI